MVTLSLCAVFLLVALVWFGGLGTLSGGQLVGDARLRGLGGSAVRVPALWVHLVKPALSGSVVVGLGMAGLVIFGAP